MHQDDLGAVGREASFSTTNCGGPAPPVLAKTGTDSDADGGGEESQPVMDGYGCRTPEKHGGGTTVGTGGRGGRRRLVAGVAAGVLVLGAMALTGCAPSGQGGSGGGRVAEGTSDARWAEGITPRWMSERMGVEVPPTAQAAQAAYRVTSRFDTGLLTFTLTRAEGEDYLGKHPPEGRWLEPTAAQTGVPSHDFAHFGVPEPETLKDGVRYGYVCPGRAGAPGTAGASATEDDPYDTSDEKCVRLYAHEYAPERTRIYLRAHFEPGISPLPVPPSSTG